MSYDLAVWLAQDALTPEAARQKYWELCERPYGSQVPGRQMLNFVGAVEERFRATPEGGGDLPWAVDPDVDEDYALLAIRRSVAHTVGPIVRELAHESGLTCFDPKSGSVLHPLVPNDSESSSLECFSGEVIRNPSVARIGEEIRSLTSDKWYTILEVAPQRYIQIGYGKEVGVRRGEFALEYRDGSPDRHWRTVISDADMAVAAFIAFLRGDLTRKGGMSWQKVEDL